MLTKLMKLRKSIGLSRPDVAQELGISVKQYMRVEFQEPSRITGVPYSLTVLEANKLYKYFVAVGARQNKDLRDINIYKLLTK